MITIPEFDHVGQLLLWLALAIIMPLIVGLVTKQSTAAYWKSALLLALSLLNGVLTEWAAAYDSFDWRRALAGAAFAWVIALAGHFGVWKPTGATDAAQDSLFRDRHDLAA
jgi:hypothetical protein